MTGTNTEFGVQFDSLADVVSFGVAPAILAYAWGIRSVTAMNPEALHQLGLFGWVCCLFFLICCAWRLARFNVKGMAPGGSKYFVGMPTPAAAGGGGPPGAGIYKFGALQGFRGLGGAVFFGASLWGPFCQPRPDFSFFCVSRA